MTFNPCMGRAVIQARGSLGKAESVCDLGSQTLSFRLQGHDDIETVPDYYKLLEFTEYQSIDLDNKGTVRTDLNHPEVPGEFSGHFDLVTNNGTGEHIFNQHAVFELMHSITKVGGLMLHVLPYINWRNHGFYSFHPRLFGDLAEANGYEIVFTWISDRDAKEIDEEVTFDEIKKPTPSDKNLMLVTCFRKRVDAEFKIPFQGKYKHLSPTTPPLFNSDYATPLLKQGSSVADRLTHAQEDAGSIPAPATIRNWSVLSEVTPHMVETDPFPYLTGRLSDHYYKELEATFPKPQDLIGDKDPSDNKLFQWSAKDALSKDMPQIWHDFFLYHTSDDFLRDVWRIFGSGIEKLYPQVGTLPKETSIRGMGQNPWQMDCQFAVNTPAKTYCSVRGPHVDNPVEVFAGLVYFPVQGDRSGGDITLYRPVGGPRFVGKAELATPKEVVKTLKYEAGNFVFFLNSPFSIHGVTPRIPSQAYRRYVNLIGEMRFDLFKLPR